MYPNIPQLWAIGKQLLFYMLDQTSSSYSYGPLQVASNALKLPNGMYLQYPKLRYSSGEFVYDSGRTGITRTHGPRLVENIIQALARIVITDQMLAIQKLPEVDVVLTVHDEIIAIGSDENATETLNKIMTIMKTSPTWCTELPLDAEGAHSKIYDK
jgi:DNA polymerase